MLFVPARRAKIILFCFLSYGAERKSSTGEGNKLSVVNLSPPARAGWCGWGQGAFKHLLQLSRSLSPALGTQ